MHSYRKKKDSKKGIQNIVAVAIVLFLAIGFVVAQKNFVKEQNADAAVSLEEERAADRAAAAEAAATELASTKE